MVGLCSKNGMPDKLFRSLISLPGSSYCRVSPTVVNELLVVKSYQFGTPWEDGLEKGLLQFQSHHHPSFEVVRLAGSERGYPVRRTAKPLGL